MNGKLAYLAWARNGGRVEIKRKVKDFDEDLQDEFWCFNPEYPVNPVKEVFFERPKLLHTDWKK